MGYRNRLGRIPKVEKAKYEHLTEWDNLDIAPYRELDGFEELFEIGISYNKNDLKAKDFFSFDIYDEYEAEFYILEKEGLKYIIDDLHKKILDNFTKLRDDCLKENGDKNKISSYFQGKVWDWQDSCFDVKPYRLDPEEGSDGKLVASYKIEYIIFELVLMYNTFDWENDYLIYNGW